MSPLDFGEHAKSAFFSFLQNKGIEYCNFGTFVVRDGMIDSVGHHATNMSDEWAEEYYARELGQHDYILKGWDLLRDGRAVARFVQDENVARMLRDIAPETAHVVGRHMHHGMESAHVILGSSDLPAAPGSHRHFAFLFGGKAQDTAIVRNEMMKLEIAAMALMDRLRPALLAKFEAADIALSSRELDCLKHASEGKMRADIAHHLGVSLPTVDLHLASLRRRLGARTIAEAVAKGYRYGLI